MNILQATMLAMARAVSVLGDPAPSYALIDGNREPTLTCGMECVVKGDSHSLSIAAASIVAKVTRDRIMRARWIPAIPVMVGRPMRAMVPVSIKMRWHAWE